MMKITLFLTIMAIAGSTFTQGVVKDCDNNCGLCIIPNQVEVAEKRMLQGVKPTCVACVNRFITKDNKCLTTVDTRITNCVRLTQGGSCMECNAGYSTPYDLSLFSYCVPNNIDRCIVAYFFQSPYGADAICFGCKDGSPNRDGTACLLHFGSAVNEAAQFSEERNSQIAQIMDRNPELKAAYTAKTEKMTQANLGQQMRTCEVGGRNFQSGQAYCFKCLPGYSNWDGVCKFTQSSDPQGCRYINSQLPAGKNCAACDMSNGWRMTNQNKCSKEF